MIHRRRLNPRVAAIVVGVAISAWSLVSGLGWVSSIFLPTPAQIARTAVDVIRSGYGGVSFWGSVWATGGRLGLAFVLVIVTASPLALAMGYFAWVRATVEPFINFYRPIPPLAYLPILIFWFGIGTTSKVLLLYLLGLPIVILPTMQAVRTVPAERINGALSLGATRRQILVQILLPSVLPDLLSSIRTAFLFMFTALVAAELVGATAGLGWMIWRASQFFQTNIVVFGVICLGVAGVAGERLLQFVQRKLTPWVGRG